MTAHSRNPSGRSSRRAFTLMELIVVVAIIVILTTIVLPAANRLWADRKVAEAENTIKALLMTARAQALRAGRVDNGDFIYYEKPLPDGPPHPASGGETGLLFYVADNGVQRVAPIAQVNAGKAAWQDVFGIMPEHEMVLPEPMRVVPRYAVVQPTATGDPYTFTDSELTNNDFDEPLSGASVPQRHRNFFTMIFSDEGHLLTWRDVLVYDFDADDDGFGDRTGLAVGRSGSVKTVTKFLTQSGAEESFMDPPGNPIADPIPYLVTGGRDTHTDAALNLPSVDGLLVYDDSLLNLFDRPEDRRAFLLREARPFYVNRLTGEVIRGPLGENIEP